MNRNNILLYGSKSTAFIIYEMLKELKKSPKYMFDPFGIKPFFKSSLIFSNKINDFKIFLKNSKYFSVCIAREDGYARYNISKKLEEFGLNSISVKSKLSYVHKNSKIGSGLIAMAKSYINRGVKMGDYCIINTGAIVDHECEIGDGVHLMGGSYLAGRVKIGNFSSVGATATILPDIKVGNHSIIGAGAVVTKDVPNNTVVVGNPAKFLRNNNSKINLKVLNTFKYEKKKN
jgi:acetyltransferase EpsM